MKKTCQFKTWCKGDKSNIENSTVHFCEDIRQNALAALTNLGHVIPIFTAWTPASFDDTMGKEIALTPCFKLTSFFTLIFAVLLATFTLYCKIRSRDLTTPTLGVICHAMANTCCTEYEVSIFNVPKI